MSLFASTGDPSDAAAAGIGATGSVIALLKALRDSDTAAATLTVSQVAVTTAAILLKAANPTRRALTLTNTGAATVFVGPTSGVTAATGHAIPAGTAFTLHAPGTVYGIMAAGTATVTTAEEAA